MEMIPCSSSMHGDATTSRLEVPQSHGTVLLSLLPLAELLWYWHVVLDLGRVVRTRVGVRAGQGVVVMQLPALPAQPYRS